MGCDIHMCVEVKYFDDDFWTNADYMRVNPYKEYPNESYLIQVPLFSDRDYSLFATLADVRNYGSTPYICKPRGIPEDVTDNTFCEIKKWGEDGHSHSYFTLKELIDFANKNLPVKYKGMISSEQLKALDKDGTIPVSWCQWTNIPNYVWAEWEDPINESLNHLIEKIKQRADELFIIFNNEWNKNYEKAYQQSDRIRIVFWFDN